MPKCFDISTGPRYFIPIRYKYHNNRNFKLNRLWSPSCPVLDRVFIDEPFTITTANLIEVRFSLVEFTETGEDDQRKYWKDT